ncbi:MAG: META domain-containing protein [Muribaculaceae bacterium]|nr:META domain-containing protein [Muribaculaceae bacterium]
MKKSIIIALLMLLSVSVVEASPRKNKARDRKEVVDPSSGELREVKVTDATRQLYGEWTIVALNGKSFVSDVRPYIYLDFSNGNRVYANNGCNTVNGTFTQRDNNISFKDLIAGTAECDYGSNATAVLKAMAEVKTFNLKSKGDMDYIDMKNAKGQITLSLRRQNLDFLNGAWTVRRIKGEDVADKDMIIVADAPMRTIHAKTSCNVISGIMRIDTDKELAVQFEDLQSLQNRCSDIDVETRLLIALEEVEWCKRESNGNILLLNKARETVIELRRTQLKRK